MALENPHQHHSSMTNNGLHTHPSQSADSANLILWYRGEDISGSPIYTVDMRHFASKTMAHSTPPTSVRNLLLNSRNDRRLKSPPPTNINERYFVAPELSNRARVQIIPDYYAQLLINPVKLTDSGTYWCRVDFRWRRTLISTAEVHVNGKSIEASKSDSLANFKNITS